MIKVIIFDFDKTIYIGDIGDTNKLHDRQVVEKCFGKGVYDYFVEKYGVNKKDIKDIVEICKKEKMDYKKLCQIFEEDLFIHKISTNIEILPNEFFKKLSKKTHLYIASMSQEKYIQHYLNLYNINKNCFKGCLYLDLVNHESKKDLFKEIINREGCHPDEVLMIGDNYFHDIQPAIEIGMKTLHLQGDFSQIYDYLTHNKICNCEEFKNKRKFISKSICQ